MKQEIWRKVEDLFHAALERTPVERQAFLHEICGADTDLRRQVELRLAKGEQAGSFLEVPALENTPVTLTAAGSLLGRQLGPYHIVSPLGAGGMGEVYRAHDSKLDRDVAIKTLYTLNICNHILTTYSSYVLSLHHISRNMSVVRMRLWHM